VRARHPLLRYAVRGVDKYLVAERLALLRCLDGCLDLKASRECFGWEKLEGRVQPREEAKVLFVEG